MSNKTEAHARIKINNMLPMLDGV